MWDLPGPGIEPVCPALAGGFSTTALPGKPELTVLKATFPLMLTGIIGTPPAFSLSLSGAGLCGVMLARAKGIDFWSLFASEFQCDLEQIIHLCTSISSSVQWADGTVLPVLQSYPENQRCIKMVWGCSLGCMTLYQL